MLKYNRSIAACPHIRGIKGAIFTQNLTLLLPQSKHFFTLDRRESLWK